MAKLRIWTSIIQQHLSKTKNSEKLWSTRFNYEWVQYKKTKFMAMWKAKIIKKNQSTRGIAHNYPVHIHWVGDGVIQWSTRAQEGIFIKNLKFYYKMQVATYWRHALERTCFNIVNHFNEECTWYFNHPLGHSKNTRKDTKIYLII